MRSTDASNSASTVRVSLWGSLRTAVTVIVGLLCLPAVHGARRLGDELADAVDPSPPQLLVLVEEAARDEQRLEVGADDLAAADALLRDQACALENRDVLLDRREAHRVMAGQLEDALLGADRAADDVAARVIREGGEHAVEFWRGGLH